MGYRINLLYMVNLPENRMGVVMFNVIVAVSGIVMFGFIIGLIFFNLRGSKK